MTSIHTASEMARDILLQTKGATGGEAWNNLNALYQKWVIRQGGLNGVLEQWHETITGRYSQSYHLGITAGGEGFDGMLPWSQDASGYARVEDNGDALEAAANNAYRTCMGWWYPGRYLAALEYVEHRDPLYHILRITPSGGRRFEVWIDTVTLLIDRTVEPGAFETVTHHSERHGGPWL